MQSPINTLIHLQSSVQCKTFALVIIAISSPISAGLQLF